MNSEFARENDVLKRLFERFGSAPAGQVWVGDDAALLGPLARPLLAADLVVEGVHVDRRWCSMFDVGWKAVSVNVSDIAAMGGAPYAVVVSLAGASAEEIEQIMEGAQSAASRYGCAIVGGDISDGTSLTVAAAVLGEAAPTVALRSGAQVGDQLYVTGPLGGSAAGLRQLRADHRATGDLVDAQLRPVARVQEGQLFAALGVHAMIDCSDGLSIDVHRVAGASGVGIVLEEVPVRAGATIEEALSGGEDYELIVSVAAGEEVVSAFVAEGLPQPVRIGYCSEDPDERSFRGDTFRPTGYEHRLGG